MGLLQHYTQLQAFIPDFTTESDAVFALNNMMALLEMTDWKQVRKDILTTDADWLDLKDVYKRQAAIWLLVPSV